LYKAASDGGMGAFIALTTSADSFRALAALGRAGRAAISRPTFSSAWPPGPASHAGPADVTDATDVADVAGGLAAPVTLAMRRAPPISAAALRDVRCLLKVLFLCSIASTGRPAGRERRRPSVPVKASTGQAGVYVTSGADAYYISSTP
jgi:hypothetical protein